MKPCRYAPLEHPLVQQFQRAIDSLTAALAPASVRQYRAVVRSFLIYLGEQHPAVGSLNQLRRDPHVLGWFVDLRSQNLAPAVYIARLLLMRCILQELAWNAQLPDLAHLIRREDIPRAPQRLPRALTPQQDQLIQQELLRRNDLPSNVLLLIRHTGMRIGECVDLAYDCLHNAGPDRWAIHVPLGKLKTERMVPIDSFVCQIVHRLRFFRSFDPLPFDGRLLARPRTQADPCQATAFLPSRCCRSCRYPHPHRPAPRNPFYRPPQRLKRIADRMNYAAGYLSFGSSVRLEYSVAFDKQSDAEDCKEAIESEGESRERFEDALGNLPFQMRSVAGKLARRCSEATTIWRKGCLVYTRIELKMADVEDLIDNLKKLNNRVSSENNMKQIGLAMHNYGMAHKTFPPAYSSDSNGKPLLSWRVLILPYLDPDLYNEFHLGEPWDSTHNKNLLTKMPAVYACPGSTVSTQGKTNYLTVRSGGTIFADGQGCTFGSIRDGLSNTITTVEVSDASAVAWTRPDDFEYDARNPIQGLVGLRQGGFIAGFADGSVRFVQSSINPEKLKLLFTKADGQPVTLDDDEQLSAPLRELRKAPPRPREEPTSAGVQRR